MAKATKATNELEHRAKESVALHIDMPQTSLGPIVPSDHEPSSADYAREDGTMLEDDARSVVSFSISRAQTRLTSPNTPSAEKAAAMGGLDGLVDDGYDKALDDMEDKPLPEKKTDYITPGETAHTHSPPSSSPSSTLPSPWRVSPKSFEKTHAKNQEKMTEPTTMLADLNIKRYMSSFNFASLPRAPYFKDFTVPSLASILGNARTRSPVSKTDLRPKRASTVGDLGSSDVFKAREHDHIDQSSEEGAKRRSSIHSMSHELSHGHSRGPDEQNESDTALGRGPEELPERKTRAAYPPGVRPLRRTTSDQSLYLRRVTSTQSSLGDDTRWENVQGQVNSRVKAIKDSFQDSNIKLPSLPNLSSLNLTSLRPDFTRARAPSDARRLPQPRSREMNTADAKDDTAPGQAANSIPISAERETSQTNLPNISQLDHALENLSGDIVIMGGYRGSVLRSSKPPNRQLWVPVKVGLNIRRVNLEVGLEPEDEERMEETIYASGMLSHIGPVDMGRRLLKRLKHCKNVESGRLRVHNYGYDWRLSPALLSRRLIRYLENLHCNAPEVPQSERGATIISHSMGGLITRHAINQRPELFAGVVYAGVPQHCVNILGPFRNGDEVLLSSKVLTAQVNFSMRSSFVLLPEDGKCFINKETKEEYPVDFYNPNDWLAYAFSPCVGTVLPPAHSPEKKTILGSLSDNLPSLPALPFAEKKATSHLNLSAVNDTAAHKLTDLADPSFHNKRAVDNHPFHSTPANTQVTISRSDALAYLTRTLAEIRTFRHQLAHNADHAARNKYPPLATLYATNTPTVSAARVTSRDAIKRSDAYDDLQFASGDGVCLAKAAQLPPGYRNSDGGRVRTERGHVGLLGDLEAVGRCLDAVWRARQGGCGRGLGTVDTAPA